MRVVCFVSFFVCLFVYFLFYEGANQEIPEGKRRIATLTELLQMQMSAGYEGGGCVHVSFNLFTS